ncbi:MAG: aconitase/3-isopropylmalate dehydratase large subunit family protein [Christensenellales bacterium]
MHALEKILAAHAGLASVRTGEIINCKVDLAGINDLYPQAMYSLREMGGERVRYPGRVLIFLDHYAPASTIRQADNQKQFREFALAQGIAGLQEINEGVCHQVMADKGYSAPGKLIVVTDSHTTTHGAFGAFSTGVGATDIACILKTGELWFRVPEIMEIALEGTLAPGVFAKDVILHVIGKLGADCAVYRGVSFTGSLIPRLSMSERLCLCNMTTEMGAKAAYIQPDEVTFDFLSKSGAGGYTVYETDPGYAYCQRHRFHVGGLAPQVAAPYSVDNVSDITMHAGTPIQQAYLGTCTGGRLEDLAAAALILKGQHIAPGVRMLVVPASRKVLKEALALGYIEVLIDAGCTLVSTGCAACLGTHEGLIAEGETCVSSSSRNFPGRMGHREGRIYLASPATLAASALRGVLTDPRPFFQEAAR